MIKGLLLDDEGDVDTGRGIIPLVSNKAIDVINSVPFNYLSGFIVLQNSHHWFAVSCKATRGRIAQNTTKNILALVVDKFADICRKEHR